MKVDSIQTSFVGGEFAPALFGRTDIAQYANACATLENFLIRPYGSVISTPGTEFINECKTGGSTGIVRLLEFVFSRDDSYVIEMGVGYFRFYTNGSLVVSPGTTAYEVAHTYEEDELFDVHICQLNDIIFIAHPDHRTQKLVRTSTTSWSLSDFDFVGGPFKDVNTDDSITINPSATTGSVTLVATDSIFTPSGSTIGHIGTYWQIGGLVSEATTGIQIQGYVQITAVASPSDATATVMKTLSAATATDSWAEGAWGGVSGYPARVTFHQQRLAFARTNAQPQNEWLSKSFVFDDFSVDDGGDVNALNLQLASNQSNDIKWLASSDSLLSGTYGGEFIVKGGSDAALTSSNAFVQKQTSWGSEPIIPKKIGNYFYYVQRFGQKLREMFYSWDLDNYKSTDVTIMSPHIADDGFKAFAYQQTPDTILWCVTSQGNIATLTREVDQNVMGWSRQTTLGAYEAIAAIPSQTRLSDEVWVVANRTINGTAHRYIERFKSQIVPDRQAECFYLHSGLSYSAYDVSTSSAATISLSATAGTTVVVTSSTAYFEANDVGQRIRAVDSDKGIVGELVITGVTSSTIAVGNVRYDFDGSSYAAGLWGISVSNISGLAHLEASTVSALVDGATDKPAKVVSSGSISLSNDGYEVHIGLPYTQTLKTLPQEIGSQRGTSQGKIQRINEVAFKVNRSHKGFKVGGSATTTDTVSYIESTTPEILYTGTIPNADFNIERISFRDPSTPMGTPELLYTGMIPNISFRDDYRYGAQVTLINDDPLPIELISLITSIDTNDK